MPHDKNGNLIEVGDLVNIPCVVKSIYQGEEYCNVTLETTEKMYPSMTPTGITLNSKQVEKVNHVSNQG